MMKRWLGFSIVLLIVTGARFASAQVSMSDTTVTTGNTVVNATSAAASSTLSYSGPPADRIDLVLGTCTGTGTGTFAITPNTNINPSGGVAISVTYTPATRGARTCNVQAIKTGTSTVLTPDPAFTASGTGVAPEIGVTPATNPYNFFGVRVLDPAVKTQAFTITNTSTDTGQNLVVSGISFSGTHAGDFRVSAGPAYGGDITPNNGTSAWTVEFDPSAAGLREATMTIASNDPITPNRTVDLQGMGTLAVIAVSDVTFTPDTRAGTTAVASTTLSNTASADAGVLTATAAALAPVAPATAGTSWFTFDVNTPTANLGCNGGTTCTLAGATMPSDKAIRVRCSPPATASGMQEATLTVTSDSDAGGDSTATLRCTAIRPNISVTPSMLDFMSQDVNSTSTAQTVTVTNNGTANLTFYYTRAGTNPAQFAASTVNSTCGADSLNQCTVTPGNSMEISVTFRPTTTGAKSATLVITNNDPDTGDSPITVTLAGAGVAPLAVADPASLNIGNVEIGKTSAGTMVSIRNDGTATLTIDSAAIAAGPYTIASGTTGSQMVAPTASATWMLTCTPTAQGANNGTFRVISNSGFGASKVTTDIALACNGQRGALSITPTSWDFMGVREGDSVQRTFTLSNTGNLAVDNIAYVLDAKLLGFTVSGVPTSLAPVGMPGASATVTVTFAPANANDGCAVTTAGDCDVIFTGSWGSTPTTTSTSIILRGDGLNATYDTYPAAPNALDFGDVRWDQLSPTMPVQIINTGGSAIAIRGVSITMGATSIAGELAIVNCTHNSVVVPCPTMASPHNSAAVNDTLVVNIRCNPADRVGMIDGTLTVSSDLNTSTPNRTVPLTCNSTTAELELTPSNMVLDFGPTDLDATPVAVTRRVTIKNIGVAALNVGNGVPAGSDLARFAFTSTTARVVPSGGSFDIDVTYTPLTEKPPNAPDTASLMFPLTGDHGGPSAVMLQISGYGADRHIGVSDAPTFPDTFKNPGDGAPVMPVTVSNTGHAPLDISAVMLDNDPIWTLDNPDPVVVPAASSHDFMVRFQPLMSGKAPTGRMVIMNNDNAAAMVSVDLNGNGLDRNVAMGPRVIPLGFTGIGIPIRLSDLAPNDPLLVENADMVNGFRIATIRVDTIVGADGTFEILDSNGDTPADIPLDPGGRHAFDITFTPNEPGDFEATATLYLDQDPTPQAQVTLRGRGLYVDARGGGGCSTSGGSRGWLALVVAAIVLAARKRRGLVAAAALVCVTGAARDSDAQNASRNLNLNIFEPTPATVSTTFHAQRAELGANGSWAASALVTYANNALVLDTSQNDDAAVKNRTMLLLGGAYVFGGNYELSVRLPLLMQSGDPAGDPTMRFGIEPASGAALADSTIQVKSQVAQTELLGGTLRFSPSLAFTLPTGTGDEFAGNDLPSVRALGLATLRHARLTTTVNLGGVIREKTPFANITQGPGVLWAAGATFRLLDQLWLGGEAFGDLVPGGKTTMDGERVALHSAEWLAGAHFKPAHTMDVGAAIGRGITSGPGGPAFRGIVSFTYTPSAEPLKPIRVPRPAQPPKDSDGDGVRDSLDECAADLEDKDGFRDDDGCPDPDNDADGLLDAADTCPGKAEDKDGFEDSDGCPDNDNDNDTIADAKDKCRNVPEDVDGFQDADGCPDLDNDKDGIGDASDKCPAEAEVINGVSDDDGCPDKGNSLVVLSPDRIETLEAIVFSGSRISRSSNNVLGQIGATLRAHPEIVRVRLTAHVQPTRNAAADQRLSEARANAVRDWLVNYGIDAARLQSSGFGGEKPLVPATSRGASQINNRLELIILERK